MSQILMLTWNIFVKDFKDLELPKNFREHRSAATSFIIVHFGYVALISTVAVIQMHLGRDKEETVKNIISFAGVFYGTVDFYWLQCYGVKSSEMKIIFIAKMLSVVFAS